MAHLRVFQEDVPPVSPNWAFLLSSYASGATEGAQLGTAGYSYDFVARLFAPLFGRLGKLVEIQKPRAELPLAISAARENDLEPINVVFRPFQDAFLTPSADNVVVPAWEFPDIPDDAFDGNPQNHWVETANRCSLILVGGPFTAKALEAAGVKAPIRIVPVPTPEPYFEIPGWQADACTPLNCSPYVLTGSDRSCSLQQTPDNNVGATVELPRQRGLRVWSPQRPTQWRARARVAGLRAYRHLLRPCLPRSIEAVVAAALRAGLAAWNQQHLPRPNFRSLSLGGVIYTSIFNPEDGRKNWEDMITAFIHALGDCEDATLVLKLITSKPQAINRVLAFYRRLNVSHRCRIVLIPDFLSEAEMLQLAGASTYYLTTTRAEGNCLPAMNYLAAGRPCVSPAHTAIADYFDNEVGFVVDSHPEPCAWPQDSQHRWRTTWHRLVWPSLVEQIRRSYEVAKRDRAAYEALAAAARERMLRWAHPDAVWPQLRSAVELLATEKLGASAGSLGTTAGSSSSAGRTVGQANRGTHAIVAGATNQPSIGARRGLMPDVIKFPAAAGSAASVGETPRRVVVSLLSFRPGRIGGTETYLRQLIARLPYADPQQEIVLLMDRQLAAEQVFPGIRRAVVDLSSREIIAARGLESISPYRARAVERVLERLQPDVVLFPQQSIFPKNVPAPCALVVHDLYHIFLPQYLSPGQRLFRQRNYAFSISRADRVVAISQFTKNSILQHYGLPPERVSVIPHGWDGGATEPLEPDAEISGKYIYYPAITRPHKNHHVLLQSIAELKSRGCFDGQLVLSGIQTPHWKTLRKQIHKLGLEQTVRHVGYVSYDRVRQLYGGAECVVFPTLFEGFGLPVLEAVEAGKKILVSPLEVFSEIGVPERFQIDFADPEQLHRGLQEPGITVLENRPWTWDESAAATMALLSSTAGYAAPARRLARAA